MIAVGCGVGVPWLSEGSTPGGAGVVIIGGECSGYFEGSCPEPACSAGDLLVASVAYYIEADPAPTMTGWVRIAQVTQPGDGLVQLAIFQRRRGATPGGPWSPNLPAGSYYLTSIVAFGGAGDVVNLATGSSASDPCDVHLASLPASAGDALLLTSARWYLGWTYPPPAGWDVVVRDDQERVTYTRQATGPTGTLDLQIPHQNTMAAAWAVIPKATP